MRKNFLFVSTEKNLKMKCEEYRELARRKVKVHTCDKAKTRGDRQDVLMC